jgi:hypothetical protein
MEHFVMRWLLLLLGLFLAEPALAQYTGNIPPNTVLGNTQPTARPPVPIPLSSGLVPPIALTDSKTAAQTADSGSFAVFTQPGITAMSIANAVCGGTTGCGYTNNDVIRGVNVAELGSTITNTTAIAGYLRNKNISGVPPSFGKNSVIMFGSGTCEVDGCKTWGVNTVLVDAAGKGMTSGTNRVIVGAEYDFIISNAANQAIGVMVTGDALVQPTLANAFAVLPLGQQSGANPVHWTGGFVTASGAASEAFIAGALARSGNNVPSQRSTFGYYDNTGVSGSIGIGVGTVAGNNTPQFSFTSTAASVDLVLSGMLKLVGFPPGGISSAGNNILGTGIGASINDLFVGSGPGLANVAVGGVNAALNLGGTTVAISPSTGTLKAVGLPAVGAGTGKRWLCIDAASKQIYEGSGGGCN